MSIKVPGGKAIPVFGQFEEMMNTLPPNKKPNKEDLVTFAVVK